MSSERQYQVAVGLTDGRVLVAGGYYTRTAEIFDPATETWTQTEPLNGFHLGAAATVDSAGRVLLVGGFDRGVTVVDTVEIFDPAFRSWTLVTGMSRARYGHGVSRLHDGSVVVTGGTSNVENWPYPATDEVEIFGLPENLPSPRTPTRRLIPGG